MIGLDDWAGMVWISHVTRVAREPCEHSGWMMESEGAHPWHADHASSFPQRCRARPPTLADLARVEGGGGGTYLTNNMNATAFAQQQSFPKPWNSIDKDYVYWSRIPEVDRLRIKLSKVLELFIRSGGS